MPQAHRPRRVRRLEPRPPTRRTRGPRSLPSGPATPSRGAPDSVSRSRRLRPTRRAPLRARHTPRSRSRRPPLARLPHPRRVVLRARDEDLAVGGARQAQDDVVVAFEEGRVEPVEVVHADQVRVGRDGELRLGCRGRCLVGCVGGGRGGGGGGRDEARVDDLVVEADDLASRRERGEGASDDVLVDVDSRERRGCRSVAAGGD